MKKVEITNFEQTTEHVENKYNNADIIFFKFSFSFGKNSYKIIGKG